MVGARELLAALRRARHADRPRLQLAAASSSAARCEIVGFEDSFDVVLSAHEVAAPKPAPDPYLEACRRLGVEPGPGGRRARGLAERRRRRGRRRPDRDRHPLGRGRRARGSPPPRRRSLARRDRRQPSWSSSSGLAAQDAAAAQHPLAELEQLAHLLRRSGGSSPASAALAASPASRRFSRRVAKSSSWPASPIASPQLGEQRLEPDPQLQRRLALAAGVEVGAGAQQQGLADVEPLAAAEHRGDPFLRAQSLLAPPAPRGAAWPRRRPRARR